MLVRVVPPADAKIAINLKRLHSRFDQVNKPKLKNVVSKGIVDGLRISDNSDVN